MKGEARYILRYVCYIYIYVTNIPISQAAKRNLHYSFNSPFLKFYQVIVWCKLYGRRGGGEKGRRGEGNYDERGVVE